MKKWMLLTMLAIAVLFAQNITAQPNDTDDLQAMLTIEKPATPDVPVMAKDLHKGMVFITGKLLNAENGKLIHQKIELKGQPEQVVFAEVSENGQYAIALANEVDIPKKLVLKIDGYKACTLRVKGKKELVLQDIYLKEKQKKAIKTTNSWIDKNMTDNPYNPFVLKF